MSLYAAMLLATVTLHVSHKYPTPYNPEAYGNNTCSGVFIGPDEILTAAHCVSKGRGYQWIRTSDEKSFSVTIVRSDTVKDLALLKIKDNKPFSHAYVSFGSPADITDEVFTVNSGQDFIGTFSKGVVSNLIYEPDYNILNLMHSAAILQGASGSGLFNSKGELIGINTAKVKDFSLAVDITEVRAFLNKRHSKWLF